ncbi:hypothetical protein KCU77_g6528, partial [Aureobasidium melanogenum]
MSKSPLAYIADQIPVYLQGQPDKVSSGTDKISNEAPRSIHYKTCQACLDSHDTETLVVLPCDHYWCQDCLSRACSNIRNEIDTKVRCDNDCIVPLEFALGVLPEAESRRLKSKLEELETEPRERFYCANRDCGEFIPPISRGNDIAAKCGKCGQSTCKLCRALDHEGDCAGSTKEDEQTFALIEKEHYQKCSQCCRVVERTQGCPHMICYCGYQFCYHCGKQILACNGCGHLEPDILAEFANGFTTPVELWEMVEEALLSLHIMPRPAGPAGLTSWFNSMLHIDGYRGPAVILGNDGSREYITGPEGMPGPEEISISDAVLFLMFDTARLEFNADGTSTLFRSEGFEQDDQSSEEEWDDEADWAM